MAPEQFRGSADARSDIWAAGTVLYEMATGRRCFAEPTLAALMDAIMHRDPVPPTSLNRSVSPGVEHVIMRALAKDPARRFHSADALAASLESLRQPSASGPRTPPINQARKHLGAKAAAMAAVAALVLAFIVAVPTFRRRLPDKTPEAGLPARKIVAVLPFRTVAGDPDANAFGDGLTETLSSRLAQLSESRAIQVIPTQEIRSAGAITTEKARSSFGVNLVVEGSLQKIGGNMRINCHLIDAATQRLLRADTITATPSDIFGLEDQAVDRVLRLMSIELSMPEQHASQRGTTNTAAYEHYLRARGYMQDYHKRENVEAAVVAYKRAIELDSNYALAYAGLGESYWREFGQTHDRALVDAATQSCLKALAMSEKLAEAHFCLGRVYQSTGDPQKAAEQFELAVVLDPNSDEAYRGLAEVYSKMDKPRKAEETYQRAISIRPQYWAGYNWLGNFYYRQARYSDAGSMFKKVVELSPDNFRGYYNLGAICVLQGRYSEAIEALEKSIAIRPSPSAYTNLGSAFFGMRRFEDAAHAYEQGLKIDEKNWRLWGNLGDARYWIPKQRAQSTSAYRKAIALAEEQLKVNPRDSELLGLMASYMAMLGEKKAAMTNIERALSMSPKDADLQYRAALVHNHFGEVELTLKWLDSALAAGFSPMTVRYAPDFDALRNDPEFQRLIQAH
jgi:serine/threonine-protein kinase